jgi:hypothetical protein
MSPPEAVSPDLQVYPQPIDFGVVKLGETATIFVTVQNDGDEDVDLDGLLPSSDALMVDDVDSFRLASGRQQTRILRWTPVSTDPLDEQLEVIVARSSSTTRVDVTGVPAFGVLEAPVGRLDLGNVPVGCVGEVALQVSNRGLDDLTLESMTLSGADELTLHEGPYDPWIPSANDGVDVAGRVLGPGESFDFRVQYVPITPGTFSEARLHIESDAAVDRVADATLAGLALDAPGPVSDSWTVPPRPTALTSLVVVNAVVASSMRDAIPTFFDVLHASALPFRVALIGTGSDDGDLDPSVAGPYTYVDDTFSVEETVGAVGAMLDGIEGDEDRGLALLAVAIEEHRDWLLDADPLWRSSTLHLTVVNNDAEQSPLIANEYVEQYEEFKDDAAPVAVNGIAGPPPSGCAPFAAEPSPMLFDATQQTSGVFLSICDSPDTNLPLLAAHMILPVFQLGDVPVDANMTVTVDDKEIENGWVYDPQLNAIRFDADSYPPEGSVVGIQYGAALACE